MVAYYQEPRPFLRHDAPIFTGVSCLTTEPFR